jgi:hypothetical protein
MTRTNCDLFTHKQSRSYLNHLVPDATTTLTRAYAKMAPEISGTRIKDKRVQSRWIIMQIVKHQTLSITYAPIFKAILCTEP